MFKKTLSGRYSLTGLFVKVVLLEKEKAYAATTNYI